MISMKQLFALAFAIVALATITLDFADARGGELAAIDLADIIAMARAANITAVTDLYKFPPPPSKPSKPDGG
jgi:hypothetical protein